MDKRLAEIKRLYNDNFDSLMEAVGKPEYKRYLKEERRLEKAEIRCQRKLGILIANPCRLAVHSCGACSGYYTKGDSRRKATIYKQAEVGKGTKCPVKETMEVKRGK